MTMRRMMVMAGGAVVPIALISILLGNQWVVEAIHREWDLSRSDGVTPLVVWLLFPKWRLTSDQILWKYIVGQDVSTVLFFVLLILFAVMGARALDPNRGALGALVTGWWATTVAGGIAGLVLGVLTTDWAMDLHNPHGPSILTSILPGVAFGFVYGWLAGLGMLLGYVMTRPRGPAAQQPGRPGQYAPQQPGMPMQPPYGQPMAQQPMQPQYPHQQRPYVPPQGQPQQPSWGGVPQQPMQQQAPPQQYGPAPVPQQPSAPQPPVPQQPSAPPPEQAPPPAPEAPGEAGQDASKDRPEDAPEDAPEAGDLDLDDRTIIDRKRDGDDT